MGGDRKASQFSLDVPSRDQQLGTRPVVPLRSAHLDILQQEGLAFFSGFRNQRAVRNAEIHIPARQEALLIEKAQKNQVNIQTELEAEVTAPVSQGQRLGTLTVRVGEQVISQVPLVAKTAVPKLTFGQMFLRVLRHMTFCG